MLNKNNKNMKAEKFYLAIVEEGIEIK